MRVCNYGTMSARFHVVELEAEGRIVVDIRAYGLGDAIDVRYPAEQYAEALARYKTICAEMERRFEA